MEARPGAELPHPEPRAEAVPVTDLGRLRLLARVAEQVGEGVAVFDNDHVLVYANPVLAAMHGCAPDELVGRHLGTFVDLSTPELANRDALEAEGGVQRIEIASQLADGLPIVTQVTVSSLRDDAGERLGQIVCVQDVSARKALEARLKRAALHDPLTDLANRRLLLDRLEQALAAAERLRTEVAVLFVDLDGFKEVNDRYGHEVGDRLLVHVARRLRSCVRAPDTLGRMGGDEFVVLVDHVTEPTAPQMVAARVVEALARPLELGELRIQVSASIGIASSRSLNWRSLLHAADEAMYQAKSAGPGQIVVSPCLP